MFVCVRHPVARVDNVFVYIIILIVVVVVVTIIRTLFDLLDGTVVAAGV